MKRNLIATSAALTALTLLLLWAPLAIANITTDNTADMTETAINQFQVIPIELPAIDTDGMARLRPISNGTLEKLLAEKIEFQKETRPLIHELKSKWTALTDELANQSPEETTSARLQNEISALDTRFAEMRLDHLMALNGIKTSAVN